MHGKGMSRGNVVWSLILSILLYLAVGCGDGSPDVVTIKIPADMVEECWGDCPLPDGWETIWGPAEDAMANRLLIGKDSGGSLKVKLSKSTYDAITDTDDSHMIFTSDRNLLKVAQSGPVTVTIADGNNYGYYDLVHNLGYQPMAIFSWKRSSASWYYLSTSYFQNSNLYAAATSGGSPTQKFIPVSEGAYAVHIDNNTTRFFVRTDSPPSGSSRDYNIKYYLLVETAS